MTHYIGGHVSAAGGAWKAFERAEAIGANCFQIFGASPRAWKVKMPSEEDYQTFKNTRAASRIDGPVFLHASYLVNLGSPDNRIFHGGVSNLTAHFEICNGLGAEGIMFHIGSWKDTTREEGIANVVRGIKKVLEAVEGESNLLLENSAGGGNKIGVEIEEIGEIMSQVDDPRLGVCIDTQHAFAGGQLEFTKAGIDDFAARCDKAFGLSQIALLHVNDSKPEFNSRVDRHENIGEGYIGIEGFAHLAKHEFFGSIPWILEVPGFDGNGPDAKNIATVQSLFTEQ
jgi:deoxyribonuclease-4